MYKFTIYVIIILNNGGAGVRQINKAYRRRQRMVVGLFKNPLKK